jgi:hypothetical protein
MRRAAASAPFFLRSCTPTYRAADWQGTQCLHDIASSGPAGGDMGAAACAARSPEDCIMLYTIAVVLIILWLLGLVTSYTLGGFIHILIVVAIIMVLLRLISGRGL